MQGTVDMGGVAYTNLDSQMARRKQIMGKGVHEVMLPPPKTASKQSMYNRQIPLALGPSDF